MSGRVDEELAARVDRTRGDRSRSDVLREALELWLRAQDVTRPLVARYAVGVPAVGLAPPGRFPCCKHCKHGSNVTAHSEACKGGCG